MAVLLGALPALVEAFPDIEILIVGRGDEEELRERRRDTGRPSALPRPGRRRREGVGDAQRRRVLRPEHRRGELRHRACRGHGRRHRGGGQRPRRVPPRSRRRQGRAAGAGRRRRGLGGGADRRCSTTTPCARRYVDAAAEAVRRYDWSVVAGQIMRVYETVAGAGGEGAGGELITWVVIDCAGGAGRRASCWWRRGPSRPPTGWTGCTSATTCRGRRSTGRWPGARWWRARSPSTPTAAARAGQAAGRAGRRRRARAAIRP